MGAGTGEAETAVETTLPEAGPGIPESRQHQQSRFRGEFQRAPVNRLRWKLFESPYSNYTEYRANYKNNIFPGLLKIDPYH
jgi:hypothetical protein